MYYRYRGLAAKSLNRFISVCSSNIGPGVRMCCLLRVSRLRVTGVLSVHSPPLSRPKLPRLDTGHQ